MNRAATTPITAAAMTDRFVKNPFRIIGFLSWLAAGAHPTASSPAAATQRGDSQRLSGSAIYTQPALTTVGRRTTSFPSPSGIYGQRGRARSRPATQPLGETTSCRMTCAGRSAYELPSRILVHP
jgi:hypothetical protein